MYLRTTNCNMRSTMGGGKTTLSITDRNICKTLRIMFRKGWDSTIPLYQHLDILPLASNIKACVCYFLLIFYFILFDFKVVFCDIRISTDLCRLFCVNLSKSWYQNNIYMYSLLEWFLLTISKKFILTRSTNLWSRSHSMLYFWLRIRRKMPNIYNY